MRRWPGDKDPRALWLKRGDRDTKFFHRTANSHSRYNNIDKLIVRENSAVNPTEIKREIITFYKKLYTETEGWRPQGNIGSCPRELHQRIEDTMMLQCPFEA